MFAAKDQKYISDESFQKENILPINPGFLLQKHKG